MTARRWKQQIDPGLRGLYAKLPNITFGPVSRRLIRRLETLLPTPRPPAGIVTRTEAVGSHELHLFIPTSGARHSGALLWIHGGGRIMGRPQQSAYHCARIAKTLGIVTASTGYRLAPEHPFPAALDDCAASWTWLVDHADALNIAPHRIVVGGESAGGGLAAELAQRLCDEPGPSPAGQLLVYPMLDDRTATRDELTADKHLVWNNASNRYGWASYLGRAPGGPNLPPYACAPRRDDLTGLPPAWLTVGTLDLFLQENRAYAQRLQSAGVSADLEIIEGGFHGLFAVARDEPAVAPIWASLLAFLRRRLDIEASEYATT